ncbi:MAG: 2-C-methyl-D-erythritol 2,4-cyclodiphosphate synthase [Bacteroidia bacterium]|nr:2-C-methyl-D-erythritol 2,4-cyclodiphosphate synthase [Bacteroidia bacterium]
MPQLRIGLGYDVHKFTEGKPLRLGGITIPHEKGLEGHSDADVLLHAICDALLGAAGLPDIGYFFPPSDPAYKGIDSRELLREVKSHIDQAGWHIVNIDTVLIAQKPRLSAFYTPIREEIGRILGIESERIGLKSTTPERMGALGREEGIAAYAVALLERTSLQ